MEGQSAGKGFEVNTLPPRSPDGIFFPQGHNIGICFPGPGRGIGLLLPPCPRTKYMLATGILLFFHVLFHVVLQIKEE